MTDLTIIDFIKFKSKLIEYSVSSRNIKAWTYIEDNKMLRLIENNKRGILITYYIANNSNELYHYQSSDKIFEDNFDGIIFIGFEFCGIPEVLENSSGDTITLKKIIFELGGFHELQERITIEDSIFSDVEDTNGVNGVNEADDIMWTVA